MNALFLAAMLATGAVEDRWIGVHLGLNATAAVDVRLAKWFYGEFATQLTGVGAIAAPQSGLVVSALLLGGVTVPLVDKSNVRLSFEAGAHGTYLWTYPVNLLALGVLAGLRLVHESGFTFAFKLPIFGYAGSPDAPRGGVLYYYIAAIPSVPIITAGYTF